MAEVKDNIEKYQWKKGDNFGKIVIVVKKDDKFTHFTDGSKIFNTAINEFLEKVEDNYIPFPHANLANNNSSVQTQQEATIVNTPITKVPEPTIMGKMITKMSKKNVVNVPIQINLNIPSPALHVMLSENMELEDLNSEIMEVVLSQIEIEKLKDYVKLNVEDFLKKYYS